jgi:hypothetical protein
MKARLNIRKRQADSDDDNDDHTVTRTNNIVRDKEVKAIVKPSILRSFGADDDDTAACMNDEKQSRKREAPIFSQPSQGIVSSSIAKDLLKSRLTFQDDLEENNDDSNAPVMKPTKKMRQSPAAIAIFLPVAEEVEEANAHESSYGRDYSAESLKALKEKQLFKQAAEQAMSDEHNIESIAVDNDAKNSTLPQTTSSNTILDDRVGLEFSGDAAEMMEEELAAASGMMEEITSQSSIKKVVIDDEEILKDRKYASILAKKQKDKRRGVGLDDDANQDDIYSNSFVDSVKKATFKSSSSKRHVSFREPMASSQLSEKPLTATNQDPDAEAWEEELLRRGTAHYSIPLASASSSSSATRGGQTIDRDDADYKNFPSIDDIVGNIQRAIDSLAKEILPSDEAKLHDLETEYERTDKEIRALLKQIDERQLSYDMLDGWCLRIEEMVKLMRLKESMVEELVEAYEAIIRDIELSITKYYQGEVEERLYPLLSMSGRAISGLDDYFIPSKDFSESILQHRPYHPQQSSNSNPVTDQQSLDLSGYPILKYLQLFHPKQTSVEISTYIHQVVASLNEKAQTMAMASQTIYEDSDLSISSMLEVFGSYRGHMFDRYNNSYMSLSLPELLDQLIKVDLYASFFYFQSKSLAGLQQLSSSWPWVKDIQHYSLSVKVEDLQRSILPESEMDGSLLPRVMSRSMMPWLMTIFTVYDPFSLQQSMAYAKICGDLYQHDLPMHDLGRMLHVIVDRFENSLSWICLLILAKPSAPRHKKKASRFDNPLSSAMDKDNRGDETSSGTVVSNEIYEFMLHELIKVLRWLGNLALFESYLSVDVLYALVWKGMMKKIYPALDAFLCQQIQSTTSSSSAEVQAYAAAIIVLCSIFTLVPQAIEDQDNSILNKQVMKRLRELLASISIAKIEASMILEIKSKIEALYTLSQGN